MSLLTAAKKENVTRHQRLISHAGLWQLNNKVISNNERFQVKPKNVIEAIADFFIPSFSYSIKTS